VMTPHIDDGHLGDFIRFMITRATIS